MGTHWKGLRDFDWSRKDCEIWMFNESSNAKDKNGKLLYPRVDAIFQLHHEAIWRNPKNRSDENHYKFLKSGKTPPIYMQDAYQDVPKSIRYPISDVISLLQNIKVVIDGKEKEFKYFSSTPEYALALVAKLYKENKRYKQVEIYGIELELESEYVYQRAGFGFWLGYLAALGVPVILQSSMFNEPMYGYEGDMVIPSKDIQARIQDLEAELGADKEQYQNEAAEFLKGLSQLVNKDVSGKIETELNDITKRNERAGILSGKIKESNRYLEKAIIMEKAAGSAVFSPGEFDGVRISYSKQLDQIRTEAILVNAQIAQSLKKLLFLKKKSHKRQRALDELGSLIADLMNKNMTIFHIVGGIQENQYYLDSYKQSLRILKEKP